MVSPLVSMAMTSLRVSGVVPAVAHSRTVKLIDITMPSPLTPDAPFLRATLKDVTPAVIETQTDQVVDRPTGLRPDGSPHPAVYRTETRQVIVQERREIWFETPCPEDLTPDFVASLQRALVARGLLHVPPSGVMDNLTRRAIRLYQRRQGLDSSILSLAAARSLGLAAVAREE